jgi:hypothetical protein
VAPRGVARSMARWGAGVKVPSVQPGVVALLGLLDDLGGLEQHVRGGVHGVGGAREAVSRPRLALAYFRLAPALLNMEAIFGPIDVMSTIAAIETMTRIRPYSVNPWPR